MRPHLVLIACAGLAACRPGPLTDAQKTAVADSARALANNLMAHFNNGDLAGAFSSYSTAPDARFAENGVTHATAEALKHSTQAVLDAAESARVTFTSQDVTILGLSAAVVTNSFQLALKPKGKPEYTTQGTWTGVLERRDGKWVVAATHRSFVNPEQLAAALAPPRAPAPAPRSPSRRR